MRQVFSSYRLSNVENVAKLLEEAGIQTWISEGRSYKGSFGRDAGYGKKDQPAPQPAVWVMRAEDQPRARELLRAAGLLETTRPDLLPIHKETGAKYFPNAILSRIRTLPAQRTANRVRLVLLAIIAVLALVTVLRMLGLA